MAEFPALPLWTDALPIRGRLVSDGWVSPDTYCKNYEPVTNMPAVYLFFIHNPDDFARGFVGYVGMATKLANRLCRHEVLREIRATKGCPLIWFKPTEKQRLRKIERAYIQLFDPPWNVIGGPRGVCFQ